MSSLELIYTRDFQHLRREKLICEVTNGNFSHAAVGFEIEKEKVVFEAVYPALRFSEYDKLVDAPNLFIINVPICEGQRKAIVKKSLELTGKLYGMDDCIIGGVNDLLGKKLSGLIDKMIDNPNTFDCSATQILIVQAAFPDFCKDVDVSTVTPENARQLALEYFQNMEDVGITKILKGGN